MTSHCPRCATALDEGPTIYRCSRCQRGVPAADVDVEYHAPTRQLATT